MIGILLNLQVKESLTFKANVCFLLLRKEYVLLRIGKGMDLNLFMWNGYQTFLLLTSPRDSVLFKATFSN